MADGGVEPAKKKCKLESIFDKFHRFQDKKSFIDSYRRLCGCSDRTNSLISNKICSCDANVEMPFSRATCHVKAAIEELYPFGSIFDRGIKMLNDVTGKEGYIPEDVEMQALLAPLLTYLFDEESHRCLREVNAETGGSGGDLETRLTVTLGSHFFSKLSVSKSFIMDKHCCQKEESLCRCEECQGKNTLKLFADTSIGHKDVWHGTLDIILDRSEIGVHITHMEDDSPGGKASREIKYKDIGSLASRNQVLAQTITFSFLQQQRHPLMKHFLIPLVLACDRAIQFFFYDSENDILLESREFGFFVNGKLSYQTVIAAWLVLNYKYLCSGPSEYILNAPKAEFPKFADTSLEIYKSRLKFQNVYVSSGGGQSTWDEIKEGWYDRCPFQWPEGHVPPT